jgi:hypothetical protein
MWHTSPYRELDVTDPNDVILAVNNAYRDMMPRTLSGLGLSGLDKINAKSILVGEEAKEQKKELLAKKEALRQTKTDLLDTLRENLANAIVKQVFCAEGGPRFDDGIHAELCEGFIADFVSKIHLLNDAIADFNSHPFLKQPLATVDPKAVTYGKAQKIVNMTMKQLYCFANALDYKESVFAFCHIPVDSIILAFFGLNGTVWSDMTSAKYNEVQKHCRAKWEEKTAERGVSGDFEKLFFAEFIIWDAGTEKKGKPRQTIDTIEIFA